ncbi:sensor histidine kinase [Georgenia wangjunii]|uniref:sensor histidine kinase n=1 Tax=Georgenia wangjunii TaxID=3117730 RepID=UPI002F2610B2
MVIVGATIFSAASDLLVGISDGEADGAADGTGVALVLMAHAALVVVAFRVSIGAAILAGTMAVSMFSDLGTGIGIVGLVISGVVIGRASRLFATSYVAFCFIWVIGSAVLHEDIRERIFVPVGLLLVSAVIGVTYAALAERNRAAALRISGFEEEQERSLRGERNRIARELHDIVAHHITMASMHANVVSMAQDSDQRDKSLKVIAGSTRQALTELRWMLDVLQGDEEEEAGNGETAVDLKLATTLASIRQNLEGIGFRTAVEYDPTVLAGLPGEVDLALGRILQEAATNVVKHGDRAQTVRISIRQSRRAVHLLVRNGIAATGAPAEESSGMGLQNMRTRASQRSGTVEAVADGSVWTLRCELPLS